MVFPAALFILGYLCRVLRFWVVLHRSNISLVSIALVVFGTSSLALATNNAWLGEILKWVGLAMYLGWSWASAGFTIVYARLFDFILFTVVWTVLNSRFDGLELGLLISVVVVLVVLLSFLLLPVMMKRCKRLVFVGLRGPASVSLMRILTRVESDYEQLRLMRPYMLFLVWVLTLAIWVCEIVSLLWLMGPRDVASTTMGVLHVMQAHFGSVVSSLYAEGETVRMMMDTFTWMEGLLGITLVCACVEFVRKGKPLLWR